MMDIKTLVFIDLESTHLPSQIPPFGPPRITEIALLACRLKHFKPPFRVADRISLCVRPPENISSETADLTGLNNYNLENQRLFVEVASTIKSFLSTLDQPICLVAHNGTNFDFPLLRAELENASVSWDDFNLFTCDSLEAFRVILPKYAEEMLICPSINSLSEEQAQQGSSTLDQKEEEEEEEETCTSAKHPCYSHSPTKSIQDERLKTPPRSQQPPKPNCPPPAPLKRKVTGRVFERGADGKRYEKRISYKLSDIYQRLYHDNSLECHHALADCEMLFKCCSIIRRELFQFLAERRSHFNVVIPMWTLKKRTDTMITRSGRILATPTRKVPMLNSSTPVRSGRQVRARRLLHVEDDDPESDDAQENEGLTLLDATRNVNL